MNRDYVAEIGIDEKSRLYLRPESADFRHIYRAAMEVNWDPEGRFLYSPKPRKWSYFDWYAQIHAAAKDEYGIVLIINENTQWVCIESELKSEITKYTAANA